VREGLDRLLGAELIFEVVDAPDITFLFKHALIQDAAYQSLLKKTRREQHVRIGEALAARFPVVVEQSPELVAQHFAAGGDPEQASSFWLRAGQRAMAGPRTTRRSPTLRGCANSWPISRGHAPETNGSWRASLF
jgi:predicted ATPase